MTHSNSSWAAGGILVYTLVNLSDNTVYTENRKYMVVYIWITQLVIFCGCQTSQLGACV